MKTISDLKDAIGKQKQKRSNNACSEVETNQNKDDIEMEPEIQDDRKFFILKVIVTITTFLATLLLVTVIVLGVNYGTAAECDRGSPTEARNYDNPGLFDELTVRELENVNNYMLTRPGLNIEPYDKASINSSYIFMIDLLLPLKAAALRQLDRGDIQPKRNAKVVVFRGNLNPPRVEEYHVGPLPVIEYFRLVTNPSYTTPRIPFSARPVSSIEYDILYQMLDDVSEELYPLLWDSYKLSYHNCTHSSNCIIYQDTAPRGLTSGDRKTWFMAFRDVEGFYLHPLGLEIQIDHKSVNTDSWSVTQIFYNGFMFDSAYTLMQYYKIGRLKLISLSPLGFKESLYSSYQRRGLSAQAVPLQGPKLVESDGRRFHVVGNHIKYMHWDFHVHMRASTGMQLFDIRFQEERIIYELSLQDSVAFYSGLDPAQSSTDHYDASLLMGRMNYELVPGVDCPDTSAFLGMHTFVDSGTPRKYKNVICIFENNGGIPLRRHFTRSKNGNFRQYGGLVNYYLVVRTITSIWSYDLIFDYIFYQNGAIEVKVSKTGYVQSTFKLPYHMTYSHSLHDDVTSSVHQHLFHYKVDLDINGLHNRFASLDFSSKTFQSPWDKSRNITMLSIDKNVREREQDIIYEDQFSNSKFDIIFNDHATSKFGSKRGYRIFNLAKSKLLTENADVTNAARWAKYPVAVTQFKEAEKMSTSIYAQNDPWKPVVDFDRFLLNNESIVDKDLVAWVTMGSLHIPHTEDVPSSSTPGNQHSFLLLPFNYFTECPSVSSPNAVRITQTDEDDGVNVNTHGTSFQSPCVQHPVGPFEYSGRWENINSDENL